MIDWLPEATRLSPWAEATVVVAGLAASGYAAADGLLELGANVIVLDEADTATNVEKAAILGVLDADVRLGPGSTALLPECDLVVASPGWRPTAPLLQQARHRGVPIWGEVELAWRMMQPDRVVPWLAVTGTNGKTTTVNMLESMLVAAGLTTSAVGNVGRPIVEAILDEVSYDVLAVELSSFQLHYAHSLTLHSAAVLNLHPDHLEWYADPATWGSDEPDAMAAYAADKARIFQRVTHACIYNVADEATMRMVENAEVTEGARAIGFTLGTSVMAMVSSASSFLTLTVGVIAGVLLAILAVTTNLPAVLLVVLTALAGASVATSGVAMLVGAMTLDRLTSQGFTQIPGGIGWTVLYLALAVLGLISQLRAISGRHRSMRQQWGSSRLVAPAH